MLGVSHAGRYALLTVAPCATVGIREMTELRSEARHKCAE